MNPELFLNFKHQHLVDLLYQRLQAHCEKNADLDEAYQKISARNKKYLFLTYLDKVIFFIKAFWSNISFLVVYTLLLFLIAIFIGIVYFVMFKGYMQSFGLWLAHFGNGMLSMCCQLFGTTIEGLQEMVIDANTMVVVNGESLSSEWLMLQGIFGIFNLLVFASIFWFFKEWVKEIRHKGALDIAVVMSKEDAQNRLNITADDDFKEIRRSFYKRYKKHKFDRKQSIKDIEAYIALYLGKDYLREKRKLTATEHLRVNLIMVKDAILYFIINLFVSLFQALSVTLIYARMILIVVENIDDFYTYAQWCEHFQKSAFTAVLGVVGEPAYQNLLSKSTLPLEQMNTLLELGSICIIFTCIFLVINMYQRWLKSVRKSYHRLTRHYYPQQMTASEAEENE